MNRKLTTALAGVCVVAFATMSHAGSLGTTNPQDVTIDIVGAIAVTEQVAPTQRIPVREEDGTFAGSLEDLGEGAAIWELNSLSIDGDTDPFLNLDFSITNVSSSPADILVSAVVPLAFAFPGPNIITGDISGTVTDTNDDGMVSLDSIGTTPFFVGTVDGADALPIAVGGLSVSSAPGISLTFGPLSDDDTFGSASSTIGIDISFTVSAGDTVTIDSFFSLEPVPEPAALGLLAIGVVGITCRRRR